MKELNKELDGDAGAYLLVHCGGRRLGIGDRIDEVAKLLKKEAKGVPFITIFTFGEYGSKDHGANTCGGLMLSFTAISKWRDGEDPNKIVRRKGMNNLIGYNWKNSSDGKIIKGRKWDRESDRPCITTSGDETFGRTRTTDHPI